MDKKLLRVCTGFLILIMGLFAQANDRKFGLGVLLGSPTAITGKYWMQKDTALDFGLAFSVSDYMLMYADYLTHYNGAFGNRDSFVSHLAPYVGIGGILVVSSSDRYRDEIFIPRRSGGVGLGVRVPLGIEFSPDKPPLGIFLEIAPGISIIPRTDIIFEGGLGVRYFF